MKYRGRHQARRKRRIVGILIAVAALALIACPFVEPYLLQVESVTLTSDDLPADIARLKIVYLSDIHQGVFFSSDRVQNLITQVNSLNPDIILLGGDYANTSDEAIAFF